VATILWTLGATQDLRDITAFISGDSEVYAATVAGRIVSAVEALNQHPRLGRVVPEYEDASIREIIVGNYRVVYRVREEVVGIIAILHGRRNLMRRLTEEPWDFG
jgi:toxin ParE1/3/4